MATVTKATTAKAATIKSAEFDEDLFETRLESLKDTQDAVQAMSTWCLTHRAHHKKIVTCWLNVFKRVRVEHRLTLFYLANDVIQYSKRKRYEFVEAWATALQRATTMVRDAKVKGKILRIFQIWEQRGVYNEEFLTDLSGLLNISPPKRSDTPVQNGEQEFQSTTLVNSIRECVQLAELTDKSFKKLPKPPVTDIEEIKQHLKEKTHSHDVGSDLERYITYIEAFKKNMQDEIKSRKNVIQNLNKAMKFYACQRGECKVVFSAYKNFGNRIKLVKKKFDEVAPALPSPVPSPDINAPSPERDAELKLPDEDQTPTPTLNLFGNANGYATYMDGKLPFNISDFKAESVKNSSQSIEVIGSRSDDDSYTPRSADIDSIGSNFYKPESVGLGLNDYGEINIPGLNPMPVPPVARSEYTSLARSAQQYGASSTEYLSSYRSQAGYAGDLYGNTGTNEAKSSTSSNSLTTNDFLRSWDITNIASWNNTSNAVNNSFTHASSMDTPVSPTIFETEQHTSAAPIEFSEHNSSNSSAGGAPADLQDHHQHNLPNSFIMSSTANKLGLSKEKTRQLDIDHRNLISLTASPNTNESEKKLSWSASTNDKSYRTNSTGEAKYNKDVAESAGKDLPKPAENGVVAENKNAVVDMDMSDEDFDAESTPSKTDAGNSNMVSVAAPSILNAWDTNMQPNNNSSFPPPPPPPPISLPPGMSMDNNWSMPWNNGPPSGGGPQCIPAPPRPPPPFPNFPYRANVPEFAAPEYNRGPNFSEGRGPNFSEGRSPHFSEGRGPNFSEGRGRGRGIWRDPPQFRNYSPRPMRGGPYFGRGGPNGPAQMGRGGNGPYRGKFRGNPSWI